jgi:hypothetical protein
MQPAWQSPQPIVTVTMNAPTPEAGWISYQPACPIRSGSFGPIVANRGSAATTAAQASAGVVTVVPTLGEGLGVGEVGLDPHATIKNRTNRSREG